MSSLLVLGLGNVLCRDDGLGVAAVETLVRTYRLPTSVRALDGGTLGLSLLHCFESGEDAILVDAVMVDEAPGSLVRLEGRAVAPAVRERLSPHQVGVADLLDALELIGSEPRNLVLLGMVPASLDLHMGLSPLVARRMPELVSALVEEIRRAGHPVEAVTHPTRLTSPRPWKVP